MKYPVDANVLSEPTKPSPYTRFVDWLQQIVKGTLIMAGHSD